MNGILGVISFIFNIANACYGYESKPTREYTIQIVFNSNFQVKNSCNSRASLKIPRSWTLAASLIGKAAGIRGSGFVDLLERLRAVTS